METNSLKMAATMHLSTLTGTIHKICNDDEQFIEVLETMKGLLQKHIDTLKAGKTPLDVVMEELSKMKIESESSKSN